MQRREDRTVRGAPCYEMGRCKRLPFKLYGMLWKVWMGEVGAGDRPFLFDLFSLLSGYFCFVGFSLSSLSFFS